MTRIASLALLLALCLAGTVSAQRSPRGDEIVTGQAPQSGSDVEWGTARAIVARPIDDVAAIVDDYASYHEFLPHFQASRILSQRGRTAMVYFEVSVMHNAATLWAQMRIRPRPDQGTTRIVEATMVQGNVNAFSARWALTPTEDGHTLVDFRILVDPDLPLPDSMLTGENVTAARRTIRSLRRRMGLPPG